MSMKFARQSILLAVCLLGLSACGSSGDAASALNPPETAMATVTVNKQGSGVVTSDSGVIDCGTICAEVTDSGGTLTLNAVASPGYRFSGWNGDGLDCAGTGACTLTVENDRTVMATFSPIDQTQYLLNIDISGSGTVTADGGTISCAADCTQSFVAGTSVTLRATPAVGYTFSGWSVTGLSCTGNTCSVPMSETRSVTAQFVALPPATFPLTVSVSPASTGSVGSLPSGIACGSDCTEQFNQGTSVTLAAAPAAGYRFDGWNGAGCTGTGTGTCVVSMSAARSVTALFSAVPVNTYGLNVALTGNGTVSSTPTGLSCPTACSATFAQDTVVTLTATAAAGYRFSGWTSSVCSGTAACTLTMTAAATVGATFTQITYPLTVSKQGTGTGTVSSAPTGIACGGTCSTNYNAGTGVVLTAAAASGSTFAGWSGACTGTASTCTVSMNAAKSAVANFTVIPSFVLTTTTTGQGTIASTPTGIACGSTCTSSFNSGTTVTLVPTAASGFVFTGWSGACTGSGACSVTMSAATSVGATFTQITYALALTKQGTGTGTIGSAPAGLSCGASCSATFNSGVNVVLTATAGSGSSFVGWTGACTGATTTCTVAMSAAKSVTATFNITGSYALALSFSGSGDVTNSPSGAVCSTNCTSSHANGSSVTLTARATAGSVFGGWQGDCSGVGTCTLTMSSAKAVTATFYPAPSAGLSVAACVPGSGRDYQVGPNAGQLATIADVPWESLAAGDTVRIFYRSAPYAGKFIISAAGTAAAPVRICGVKGPNGERPVVTGVSAPTRRALGGTMGAQGSYAAQYNESRGVIYMSKKTADAWTSFPSHIQIDGLKISGAQPAHQFTDSFGATRNYLAFGACIWIDRGQNVTIADNEITDCSQGIYSRSAEDGDFTVTKNLRIAGNTFTNYGLAGDQSVHGAYTASMGVIYEFNRFGAMRSGADGNAIKDRSTGTVVRFNRIEAGAHAIDLVEAEDFPNVARAQTSYRTTFVYGNQITKNGSLGSTIHYGGDHAGSEANYRKGTLYFYNNTVRLTGGGTAQIFQISTTEEKVEAWNNVFYADGSTTLGFRAPQDNAAGYVAGGILNLGRNWVQGTWYDVSEYHTLGGQLNGTANLIVGTWASVPVNPTTMIPSVGAPIVDAGLTPSSASTATAPHPLNWQLDAQFNPKPRTANGAATDLGALEL